MGGFATRFARNRPAVAGLVVLAAIVAIALFAPVLYPHSPFALVGKPFQPPFAEFLFGTDQLGRDVTAEVVHGARTTLLIGLLATAAAVAFGMIVGGVAGYFGGRADALLMRFTEIFQTIPFFLFFRLVGLSDTVWGLALIYLTFNLALVIWMMRSFFDAVPRALEEAAWLDGCGIWSAPAPTCGSS